MIMWILIMWTIIALAIISIFYLSIRVPHLINIENISELGNFKLFSLGLLITLVFSGIIALCIDLINMIVCIIYMAIIWAVSDLTFRIIEKLTNITFEHYYAGWTALIISIIVFGIGWHQAHHVSQTNYEIITNKDIPDFKIAMFADSHIGTTFNAEGFAKHLEKIQAQNPDIVFVVGDYIDDDTTKEDMISATEALGQLKTKYGIYFVFGNHDKGYYGPEHRGFSVKELIDELTQNDIKILLDESVLINNSFYVIGRQDYSAVKEQGGLRKSIKELIKNLDKSKYMIVLDHQPTEYDEQADAKVDLVLSGHTHGGQLFPFNQVGKLIKANDLVYGHEKRQNTDFIVTSGISDWAIKFKTGTKSEFVIIDIRKEY